MRSPVVHGTYCEDGKLQGLLEMADIPYGGCGVTASAAAMDKIISKELFIRAGIPVCPYVPAAAEELEEDLDGVVLRIERELDIRFMSSRRTRAPASAFPECLTAVRSGRRWKYAAGFDRRTS